MFKFNWFFNNNNFIPALQTNGYAEPKAPRAILENFYFADPSKTEEPTAKKLDDARKKGQVPKSTDMVSSIILIVGVLILVSLGQYGYDSCLEFFAYYFKNNIGIHLQEADITPLLMYCIITFVKLTGIIFIAVMVIGVAANIAQTGFLFTTEPLKPKFSKINPITGFKNILLTRKALFNLFKSIAKCGVAGLVAYNYIRNNIEVFSKVTSVPIEMAFSYVVDIIIGVAFQVAFAMLIIAIIDLIFQRRDFKKELRMTKQEIKDENKQAEGNPEVKGKRRQKQMQMAMNRMLSAMNDATVVVTNPTHFAIAIKYVDGEDDIPVVIAKGADFVAGKIRELAKEYNIPIIENKPLARALYKKVEPGDIVPTEFFKAIAEILVQVMKLKKRTG